MIKINNLEKLPHIDGFDDVVTHVHWSSDVMCGVTELSAPEGDFIPFEQLDEAAVTEWVRATLSEAQLALIDAGLQEPELITPPWEAQ